VRGCCGAAAICGCVVVVAGGALGGAFCMLRFCDELADRC
jgi:hypothetical protein